MEDTEPKMQVSYRDNRTYIIKMQGSIDDADFANFRVEFEKLLNQGACCILFHIQGITYVPPTLMKEFSQYMNSVNDLISRRLIASSVIVYSTFTKLLLNMVYNIRAPIRPNKVVTDLEEGYKFVQEVKQSIDSQK